MMLILQAEKKAEMSHQILITGAAGGSQGSTGRLVANFLLQHIFPFAPSPMKLDARSDESVPKRRKSLKAISLNSASVHAAIKGVKRAYFTYPVAAGC